ncbi:N-acetylmuramidase domain-containing protein [Alloyangia pacifica]|uniref:N-acetylmuramidase domain-containing protein n=1 Tax=Alloyangia pacifica TaxID=311180 RepID=UPI001CFD479D|nr:N-acetylmuramidase family protein [Alloyangia pacifica]
MRDEIRALQMALNELGFDAGPEDGILGERTRGAAGDYLASRQVTSTIAPPRFTGAAKRLDDIDLPRIGAQIGLGEDELHAVMEVEARGSGFDSQDRVTQLYEPHVFYRELGPGAERDRAVAQGLAYKSWGTRAYPKDSYPRLLAAIKINEEAALRSCSWGLGQIMGFNAEMIGYPSARAMVEAFAEDEAAQLQGLVDYIVAAGLDDELRRHDWAGFARGYNGPSYATHGYHTKLRSAFLKWDAIPDTTYPEAA